jgi:antitoxin MazE
MYILTKGELMRTRVQKWGNSLAVRIPRSFAAEAGFEKESPVDISLEDGKLVVSAVTQAVPTLGELLAAVTEDNIHREIDTGSASGDEAW